MSLPHGAVSWSAVCDRGTSWTYSLTVSCEFAQFNFRNLQYVYMYHQQCSALSYQSQNFIMVNLLPRLGPVVNIFLSIFHIKYYKNEDNKR